MRFRRTSQDDEARAFCISVLAKPKSACEDEPGIAKKVVDATKTPAAKHATATIAHLSHRL